MVFIAPALPLPPATPRLKAMREFDEPRDDYVGWGKWNRHYWVEHYEDFLEFFFSQCFTEPHSTKQREDCVGWGLETDAETLVATQLAPRLQDEEGVRALLSRIDCPMLVIHGSDDAVRPCASGARLAELANGALVGPRGLGPSAPRPRPGQGEPARCATSSRRPPPPRSWVRGQVPPQARALRLLPDRARPRAARRGDRRRAAQAPSRPRDRLARPAPGHGGARGARRADPSGQRVPGERVAATSRASRPSTTCTASRRSGGWTRSCSPTSWSSTTSSARSTYDLWIGDEAWELDYYLHENPEQKRPPYVWLTDFVGWLPMADGGEHEAFLTADYNAEMIEHIARFPRVRDRAVFVGNPDDIVPERFASRPAAGSGTGPRSTTRSPATSRASTRRLRRPGGAPGRARLRRRRAGLHRHRRRLGRRRRPAAARDRRLPGGEGARARRCG